MEKMYFGAAYYREYLPYERLEQDLQLMQEAGFNYVRIAESTWSTYEKDDGVFDFSSVLAVLDALPRRGMGAIVGLPTYAVPAWLVRKYPEIMATTPNGKNRYGGRHLMDITHPAYLYYAERIVTKLLEAVSAHPAVIGYQIDNETKSYDTASPNVQIAFVKWLKRKFKGDLQALNAAYGLDYWSNRIDSWEDFPDICGTINGSLACAFREYQRVITADFVEHFAAIVRRCRRPGQFITHNLDFDWRERSYGMQEQSDQLRESRVFDICGSDIYYFSQDRLKAHDISFCGDYIRGLRDERFLVLETNAQGFANWTPYPGQLRLQALMLFASGARSVGYWNWHSIHNSYESYWKGILSHDLEPNEIYREIASIGRDLPKLEPVLSGYHQQNQVCIVVSNEALSAVDYFPLTGSAPALGQVQCHQYNDVLRCYSNALCDANIGTDIKNINDDAIFSYPILVVPLLYAVSTERLQRLNEYVRQGGCIVYSFKSAFADENIKIRPELQPAVIREVTGCSYQLFSEPNHVRLHAEGLDLSGADCSVNTFMELLRAEPGTEVLASYEHQYYRQYAAITYRQTGRGGAAYIGAGVSGEVIAAVVQYTARKAGLKLKEPLAQPLTVKSGLNDKGQQVRFILNFSSAKQRFAYPYADCRDVLSGREIKSGEEVELPDWGGLVTVTDPA